MSAKPVYRVGVAGLDPRDVRLIEIVFRHSQYNKYDFRLAVSLKPADLDLLIANPDAAEGLQAYEAIRHSARRVPLIAAVANGGRSPARHVIAIDRLTLQLLPILNRVVAAEFEGEAPPADAGRPLLEPDVLFGNASSATPEVGTTPELPEEVFPKAHWSDPYGAPAAPLEVAHKAMEPAVPQPEAAGRPKLLVFPRAAAGQGGAGANSLRVLVVDDSPTVRRQLNLAFERMGIACEAVEGGEAALQRLAAQHFDLALVDVLMPDMDGYRLTREIRRDRTRPRLPVIILTSRSSPFDLARGALAGCDAYLTKPVPFRTLEAAVTKQLRKSLAIDDLSGLMNESPTLTLEPAGVARPESRLARLFGR